MRKSLVALTVLVVSFNLFFLFLIQNDSREQVQRPETIGSPYTPPAPSVPPQEEQVKPEPKPNEVLPTFVQVPSFRGQSGNSVYEDVLSHSKDQPFGNSNGRATNVHETAHGIHAYLRNSYGKKNGFYTLQGRGVLVDEPRMRKRQVADFVPQSLRSYRFGTYITGQTAWDDTPLYVYDEWTAYVLGGMTNVEDVQAGRYSGGWTDGVSGCLEFSIYAIATCMAIEKYDPEYWRSNTQFRNYTIFMLRQAHKTFMMGRAMEQFKWEKQDKLLNEFLHGESAAPMRKFVKENLNGVWLEGDLSVGLTHYEEHQRVSLSPEKEKHRKIKP